MPLANFATAILAACLVLVASKQSALAATATKVTDPQVAAITKSATPSFTVDGADVGEFDPERHTNIPVCAKAASAPYSSPHL